QVIESKKNGLLVPVDDVLALAEGFRRLLSDEPFRRRLGESARETVVEKFSMDRALDALCALYRPEEGA
ncbi:MAG TPA: glycosyltransferase family 1 protein, partial [Clostridia bacterium]|nr:glycosyltransferase family 1 protein [Clostridia bacterium]